MNDNELAELLKRYLAGLCTEQEEWIIEQWYADLDNMSVASPQGEKTYFAHTIWDSIQNKSNLQPLSSNPKSTVFDRWYIYVAAACACLACLILCEQHIGLENIFRVIDEGEVRMILQKNDAEKPMHIELEDGSRVVLNAGSRIKYPYRFKNHVREIYLDGDAYFDVKRNEQKPFHVYTEDIQTIVLGTSFSIRPGMKDQRDIEIDVISGKVMVQYMDVKNAEPAIMLTQNQKAVYKHQHKNFELGIVQIPQLIATESPLTEDDSFIFRGAPLQDVLTRIEQGYGIHIELQNTDLIDCPITADLSEQEMYTKLDIIGASVGANYTLDGNRILFSGGQCE
jgi:transmembrane sensor